MEKISGILPSNARIKSVDMKSSHAARPGAPAFGRQMGRTSSEDRVSFGDVTAVQENLSSGYNPKEARHAKIAEELTKNFFENRLKTDLEMEKVKTPDERATMEAPIEVSAEDLKVESYEPLDLYA